MTGRKSDIVLRRCKELKIEEVHKHKSIRPENIAYIGDDINDCECLEFLLNNNGVTGCPKDAVEKMRKISSFICGLDGGKGAVREFIEHLTS